MKMSHYKKQQIEQRIENLTLILCGLALAALFIAAMVIGH